MNNHIQASFDTLLIQSSDAAASYLRKAVSEIDKVLGDGYASKNPQLIAAFMQSASSDMNASMKAKVFESALLDISNSLTLISESLESNESL